MVEDIDLKSRTEKYVIRASLEFLDRQCRPVFSERVRPQSRFKEQPMEFFSNDQLRAVVSFDVLQEIRRFALNEVITTILREN